MTGIQAKQIKPAVMSEGEAAAYLGVSAELLRRLRADSAGGKSPAPPYVRIGRRLIRYRQVDLDEWLADRAAETRDGAAA